jgi:hypothetical protein
MHALTELNTGCCIGHVLQSRSSTHRMQTRGAAGPPPSSARAWIFGTGRTGSCEVHSHSTLKPFVYSYTNIKSL